MAETDVELSVGLDTSDVASRSKSLQNELKQVFESVDTTKVDEKTKKTLVRLSELSGKATDVQKQMQGMEDALASSLEEQADAAYDKIVELKEKLERTTSEPLRDSYSAELEKQQTLVDGLEDKLDALYSGDMSAAQMLSQDNEEYQKMEQKLLGINNQMAILLSTTRKVGGGTNSILRIFTGIMAATKKAGNAIKQHFRSGQQSIKQLGVTAKNVLGVLIGFATIKALFMKMKAAIVEGIKNLAQWNDGNNDTNKAISTLMSSLAELKNALASAFAPIIQVAAPALNQLIRLCINAANSMGMLLTKLTGGSTFIKATKIQKDFAKSLKGTNQALATFDNLNLLSKQDGVNETNPNEMFTEVPIQDMQGDLIDFFKVFKDSWDQYGSTVIDSWSTALSNIKQLGVDIKDSFMEIWTSDSGSELLGHWLSIISSIGDTVGNLAKQFDTAWNKNNIGTEIFQSVFDILNLVAGTIEECANYTAEWADQLDFYPLLDSIHNVLESIKTVMEPILEFGVKIYEDIILPIAEWIMEDLLPAFLNVVSGALDVIGVLLQGIKPVAEWFIDEVIIPLGKAVGKAAVDALNAVGDALKWIVHNKTAVSILKTFAGVVTVVIGVVTAWNVVCGIATGLLTALSAAAGILSGVIAVLTSPITVVIAAIAALVAAGIALYKHWDEVKDNATRIWNGIKDTIGDMIDVVTDKFHSFADNVRNIWNSITNTLRGGVNSLLGGLEYFINLIIYGLNTIIWALNNLRIDMPNWVREMFGIGSIGFNIPTIRDVRIPRLAEGAVIPPNKEFMAVLGDQSSGTNIEAPLDTIKQAVAEVISDEMISLLTQQVNLLQQIEDKDIVVSENNLFKTVRNKARSYEKSTGQNAFSF